MGHKYITLGLLRSLAKHLILYNFITYFHLLKTSTKFIKLSFIKQKPHVFFPLEQKEDYKQ